MTAEGTPSTELQFILNAIVEGLCGVDAMGRATFCNEALLKMTGYSQQELIGKSLHKLLHYRRLDGTEYPEESCPLRAAIVAQQPIHLLDEYLWRKDETWFPAECWAYPLCQCLGRTTHIITLSDLTARKRSEEALRVSQERFQQISTHVNQIFYLLDLRNDHLEYLSPAFETITGCACEEAYANPAFWRTVVECRYHGRVKADLKALHRGEAVNSEYQIRHVSGGTRWIKNQATPIRNGDGAVHRVAGVAEDITEAMESKEVLRQSEEKFRRILASVPDVTWTSDQNGRTAYISPKVEAVLGYSEREFYAARGEIWRNHLHPEDAARVLNAYRALFEDRSAFDEEYRIRRKDGKWIWLHDRAIRTHEEGGLLYADGIFCDVTRRKEAEVELQSKTAFLEAQANSTIDGILVIDDHGKRLLANQRFFELFSIPPHLQAIEEDRLLLEYVTKLVDNPAAFRSKVRHLYHHRHETSRDEIEFRDGTVLDRYSSPVVDKGGRYYGRIWIFRDITERKRSEDILQQLSLAVEQSPVSVVITDPRGSISYVNRKFTECTGYSLDEVAGKNPRILNSGRADPGSFQDLWKTIMHGHEWRGEFCNKKKNGELFWEAATITPIKNPKGEITHFLAIKEDITERRVLEGQLRQAQKLEGIGQLAAGIAHEINTPTQFVTDNLTFLRDSWTSTYRLLELYRGIVRRSITSLPADVLASVEAAERDCDLEFIATEVPTAIDQGLDGARRVGKIVRAMKEFSHPDSADKTATDLNRAIESTITVARNEWKYVADIALELDASLPPVICYPGEINQVILNLLINAAHSIKERVKEGQKGRITVRTRGMGDFVQITIKDTGTGIPEAIRTRIFEPFFTTKEVGKGTGQGLALAHSVIVKKHHGRIWFETEMGVGTTFFIDLPTDSVLIKDGE